MRSLLVAFLIGLSGIGVGYYQYTKKYEGVQETFRDPKERLAEVYQERFGKDQGVAIGEAVPKVEVIGGTDYFFGTMMYRTTRTNKFVFKNIGTAPLTLTVIYSSCKCTIGTLEKDVLQPGETAGVELTWSAQNMLQEFSQTATIATNDPDQREVKLTVRGHISNSIIVDPIRVLAGEFSSRQVSKFSTRVFSLYEKPLEMETLNWTDVATRDRVKLTHKTRKLEPGEDPEHLDAKYVADIDIEIAPGMPTGSIDSRVDIKTNLEETTPLSFAFTGKVTSDLRIIAGDNYDERLNVLTIGRVASTEGTIMKFMIGVKSDTDKKPEILVQSKRPDQALEVRVLAPSVRGNQSIFPIEVEVPKGSAPVSMLGTTPTNFGKIVFRTNLEFSPEISIFVRVEVEDR